MKTQTLLQKFPVAVPGWTVTQKGILRASLSRVSRPGPAGAPRDPWGRPFDAGALHEVTIDGETVEFRGIVRVDGRPVEVQLINT